MSDDLTARDVTALTVAESHDEPDTSPERVIAAVRKALPVCISEETCEPDDDHAREFLAALAAAGYTIVTTNPVRRIDDVPCTDYMYGHHLSYKTIADPPAAPDSTCLRCGKRFDLREVVPDAR